MKTAAILHYLLALALAPLLPGLINRVKAFFGGRYGPPLAQAYYDLWKLFQKRPVYSRTTTWVFRAGPLVNVAGLLVVLALLTLFSLPIGGLLGWGLAAAIISTVENEIYRIPLVVHASALAWSALVVAAAAGFSGLTVRRKLDRLDLVAVLKTRE